MRVPFLPVVLATGAWGYSIRYPRQASSNDEGNNTVTGVPVRNDIPVFHTRSWPLLDPEQALAALHAKASATPSAVSFLPGVPVPTNFAQLKADAEKMVGQVGADIKNVLSGSLDKAEGKPVQKAAAASSSSCTNPAVHYEWDNLTNQHKLDYVNAQKCLFGLPARSGLPGTKTRWDDLAAIHQHQSPIIHNVGQFFAWHRYFLHILELEMRGACGFTGKMTWWDETKNAGNFNGADMMTQQYFGHMPDGNAVCIISGVFANTELHIGPGTSNTNHCLSRGCNEKLSAQITQNFVNTCNSYTDFEDMNNCQFFGPHAYGHDAVGGVMSDVDTSPGDPVFFLHHAFVDHNYRIWENMNSARLSQIGGYTTQNCGNNCQPTTLNYVLSSLNFYPSVTVGDVMNTEGGYLCYKYDY